MKNDITAEYEITDEGRKALEVYRNRDMKDPRNFQDKSHRLQANAEKVFLTGIEDGLPVTVIYEEMLKPWAARRELRIGFKIFDPIFDNMVDNGLIVRVDDVTELSELPSAFKKDFGQYE